MPFEVDQPIAARYLRGFAKLSHARVLDVGCATGRLMRRYAHRVQSVIGTDSDAQVLTVALRERRPAQRARMAFAQAKAEALPFRAETFDVAIMAWTL